MDLSRLIHSSQLVWSIQILDNTQANLEYRCPLDYLWHNFQANQVLLELFHLRYLQEESKSINNKKF